MEYTKQEKDQFIRLFVRDQIISQIVGSVAILAVVVGIPLGIYLYETSMSDKRADSLKNNYIVQSQSAPAAAEKTSSDNTEKSPAFTLPPVSDKKFLEAEAVPDLIKQIQDLTAEAVVEAEPSSNAGSSAAFPSPSSRENAGESAGFYSYANNSSHGSGGFAGGAGGGKGAGGGSGGGSLATSSPLAQTAAPSLSAADLLAAPPLSWQDGILVGSGDLTHSVVIPADVIFSPGHSPGEINVLSSMVLGSILRIEFTDAVHDMITVGPGGVLDITQLRTIEVVGEPPLDLTDAQRTLSFPIIDYTNGTLIGSFDNVTVKFLDMHFKNGFITDDGGNVSINGVHNPEMPSVLVFPVMVLIGSLLLFLRKKLSKKSA